MTPACCCFAIWEGYGGLPYLGSLRPERLAIPNRNMILLSGPLSAMLEESFDEGWYRTTSELRQPYDYRSPSLWWPDDRARRSPRSTISPSATTSPPPTSSSSAT
jgi:hypothetical protein